MTAAPTTTVPDAITNIPSAAPPASTEEAREILQDAVNKAETGPADKTELVDAEAIGAGKQRIGCRPHNHSWSNHLFSQSNRPWPMSHSN